MVTPPTTNPDTNRPSPTPMTSPNNECDGGICSQPTPCPAGACDADPPADMMTETGPGGPEYPTMCPGGVVRYWDVPVEPTALDFSPDGTLIGLGGKDGFVIVYRALDGQELSRHHKHPLQISSLRFSPDSRALAATSHDGTLSYWTLDTTPPRPWVHGGIVFSVAFAPDGLSMAVGAQGGLYLLKVAPVIQMALKWDGQFVRSVSFLPGAQQIIGTEGQGAGRIVVLNAANLTLVKMLTMEAMPVLRMAVAAKNGMGALYPVGPRLKHVGFATGALASFDQHTAPIEDVRYSEDGTRYATTSSEGTKVWASANFQVTRTLPGPSSLVALSPDGKRLVRQDGRRLLVHCLD
jgi:WD40 repeat protein